MAESARVIGHLTVELEMAKSLTVAKIPGERRQAMVKLLHETNAYPIAALCRLLNVPRSRYYDGATTVQDTTVQQTIEAACAV